jgi:hypothetical protein
VLDWFIDKLNVHQSFPDGGLPVVGQHGRILHDLQTGELVSDTVDTLKHEGSHSSILNVRCDGSSISITGNPSRYNRSDNLWGLMTFDDCIDIYNQVLASYDLPALTKCTKVDYAQSPDGRASRLVTDGALIRHVDWTRNFMVGKGKEQAFLRGASTLSIGRGLQPYLYHNGDTVDWGTHRKRVRGEGSTYRYDKMYNKSRDLIDHRSKRLKYSTQDEVRYYDRLIEFCMANGIVREEQSKKAPFLKKHGRLAFYGLCNESDFLPHLADIETAIKRLEVHHMPYETIAEQLINKGICKSAQSANSTESYYEKWRHGSPIDRSKSQYHVHRARLLSVGVDIAMQHDVSRLPPQIRSGEIIELKPARIPSWYRMPGQRNLRAVA